MNRYSTRDEAIQAEIVDPIAAGDALATDYDLEAIAAEVLGDYATGYACTVSVEEFWEIVEKHDLTA